MTFEKLPSGSYRIKEMHQGKYVSVTVPYKPSKEEALLLLADKIKKPPCKLTFREATDEFIKAKENILSPRTIREYSLYPDRLPSWFNALQLDKIKTAEAQRLVNELAKDKSPKTIKCLYGFVTGVLRLYNLQSNVCATLPQIEVNEPVIPLKTDITRLLEYTDEHAPHFYIPICLGMLGLRRSEVLALGINDLTENNTIVICKAVVQDSQGNWVAKTTKTPKSVRTIPVPSELADRIRMQGYIYKGGAQSISNYMKRTQKILGMEEFSFHKLRHFLCSYLMDMGYDSQTIQEWGGWQSDYTMKRVYAHSLKMKQEDERRKIADSLF